MKVDQLQHYVKFIFRGSGDNECFSTTDINLLKLIRNKNSSKPIRELNIGDRIYFDTPDDKVYEIEDITIRHLVDDLELLKYGIDMEDCSEQQGEMKDWLFSILIDMQTI